MGSSRAKLNQQGLIVCGLSKTYDRKIKALQEVDIQVEKGMFGLLGPNGAGKSTLMRTLATLQRPDSGSFSLDGLDGLQQPNTFRRMLGYLPQSIGAYPGVSGQKLMERFAWLKGLVSKKERRTEIQRLLELVNLHEHREQQVSTYSGGMLRRFGIALALIGGPRLLIVDEPTAGLDPVERNRFHRVLSDVASESVVLLSTHIVEDVENLCERLSILKGGRIVAQGSTQALCEPLQGKLWTRIVPRGEKTPDSVLHLSAAPSGTRIVVKRSQSPGPEYQAHSPRLNDLYHDALATADQEVA